jgi:two-component system, chemotaxis family, protein-glutamate methylesterase/glutaminase
MSSAVPAAASVFAADDPIRVMIVDDAIVVRRLLARWIDSEPDLTVAACLRTGREAVEQIEKADPDVVVLDVEMPELDGISALPLLLRKKRNLIVIMASALTRRCAEVSLRALSLGAADYVPKPEAATDATTSAAFQRELIEKIRSLGGRGRARMAHRRSDAAKTLGRLHGSSAAAETTTFALRPFARVSPQALLIGSSTGGPQALTTLLQQLTATLERAPILITQHMPPTFTTVLAEHLARISGRRVREAEHGEAVVPGNVYVAPGGRHMRVARGRNAISIALGDDPPINFCKPAVDPLLTSAAATWGAGTLAVILTGMGSDGSEGAHKIVAAGGSIIAQNEATSAVWGMPRAVAQAGLCSAVLPLTEIGTVVNRLFSRAAP